MATLEVLNGPEVGRKVELAHEVFFIGRDPNNHLTLSDRTVSRKHAVINQIEGKFVLSNLKSLKGVLVNGEKTEEAALEHGDEIAIGAVRLRFRVEAKKTAGTFLPKRRGFLWIPAALASFLLIGGGVFLWQKGRGSRAAGVELRAIEENYAEGVRLVNEEKDMAGAKARLEKVLQLDPQTTTPQARKAMKLLEDLR